MLFCLHSEHARENLHCKHKRVDMVYPVPYLIPHCKSKRNLGERNETKNRSQANYDNA